MFGSPSAARMGSGSGRQKSTAQHRVRLHRPMSYTCGASVGSIVEQRFAYKDRWALPSAPKRHLPDPDDLPPRLSRIWMVAGGAHLACGSGRSPLLPERSAAPRRPSTYSSSPFWRSVPRTPGGEGNAESGTLGDDDGVASFHPFATTPQSSVGFERSEMALWDSGQAQTLTRWRAGQSR